MFWDQKVPVFGYPEKTLDDIWNYPIGVQCLKCLKMLKSFLLLWDFFQTLIDLHKEIKQHTSSGEYWQRWKAKMSPWSWISSGWEELHWWGKRQELNFTPWKLIFCIQSIFSRDWKFFTFSTISGGHAALEEDLARNDWAEVYQQQVSSEFPPIYFCNMKHFVDLKTTLD